MGAHNSGNLAFLRHHAVRFANIAVLAVLALLLYRQVDAGELRTSIGHADVALVAAAFALDVPIAVLFVLRSHFVLVRLGYRVEARVLVPAIILGNVAGSLTPASTGELLRATALRGHAKVPTADGVALVLFERGVSVYLMALTTGVAAAYVTLSPGRALAVAVASVPLLSAPAFAPLLLRRRSAASDATRRSLVARALGHVSDAADRLSWIVEDRRLLAIWSLITALILTMSMLQVWLLARSISDVVDPAQAWVAFGGSQLAGIASLLPLGVGALDGSLAAILRKFGLTFEQGAGAAVLLRLIVTIPYGITAILCHLYLQHVGATRQRGSGDAQP
jgi:uncharacterized protein (TIRG00374 family)